MSQYSFLNGEIIAAEDIKLHISDLAIIRGYGIFDFFRTSNGLPLFMDDHLKRFENSARLFRLKHNYSNDFIKENIHELIALNRFDESSIKLIMTGGYSANGFNPGDPNFIIYVEEHIEPPSEYYSEGIRLLTHRHIRQFPEVKSTNYLTALMLFDQLQEKEALDVLYHDGIYISEVSRSNFFIVKDNCVITPSEGVLKGITRGKTLEIADEHYKIETRPVKLDEVMAADEAFITSSVKRIMPVVKVDDQIIDNGAPGKISQHLLSLFMQREQDYVLSEK